MNFETVANQYLHQLETGSNPCRPATIKAYRSILKTHLVSRFGTESLESLAQSNNRRGSFLHSVESAIFGGGEKLPTEPQHNLFAGSPPHLRQRAGWRGRQSRIELNRPQQRAGCIGSGL